MSLDKFKGAQKNRYIIIATASFVLLGGGIGASALMNSGQRDENLAATESISEDEANKEAVSAPTISEIPDQNHVDVDNVEPDDTNYGFDDYGNSNDNSSDYGSYDYDYDYGPDRSPPSTRYQSSGNIEPEEPVCLEEVKDSYVSLYNSRVSNEKTKYDNAISQEEFRHEQNIRDINDSLASRGMTSSGAAELEINKENERHQQEVSLLTSNHELALSELEAEHLSELRAIDC